MTTALSFPTNPTLGQEFIPNNSAVYEWRGDRWSTAWPVQNGRAYSVAEGGDAATQPDNTIDGGTA